MYIKEEICHHVNNKYPVNNKWLNQTIYTYFIYKDITINYDNIGSKD